MIRDSKKQKSDNETETAQVAGAASNQIRTEEIDKKTENESEKDLNQSTFSRRTSIVLGMFLYCLAALGIASHYCKSNYNETLPVRYKQYGNPTKPCVVIIPGLDGATSFFQV